MNTTVTAITNLKPGDRIPTPKGIVTVLRIVEERITEDFRISRKAERPATIMIVGTIGGKTVKLTAPRTATIDIEA